MLERLFGLNQDEQFTYLAPRILITGSVIIIGVITMAVSGGGGGMIVAIAALYWAGEFLRNWFGLTVFAALFSRNIVIGLLLIIAYIVIGYCVGLVTFAVAFVRFIFLLIARAVR